MELKNILSGKPLREASTASLLSGGLPTMIKIKCENLNACYGTIQDGRDRYA